MAKYPFSNPGNRHAVVFYALLVAETYAIAPLAGLLAIPYVGVVAVAFVLNLAMALRGCVLGIVCEPYGS